MATNFFESDVGSVLSRVAEAAAGDVYAVNPARESLPEFVFRLHGMDDPPTVKILVDGDSLKAVMADFIVAGHAADLHADGSLEMRVLSEPPAASLFVAENLVVSVVEGGDTVGGLTADEEGFVTTVRDHYDAAWAAADEHSLRTPPLSRVRETLTEDIDPDTAADFDAVLEELDVARGDGQGLDEVTIAILAAARNGELLYDISKWGEDVGLASKATFSRTKSDLEDAGVVRTEKVPIDVGRPRLRLRLAEDRLQGADPPELVSLTAERLANEE